MSSPRFVHLHLHTEFSMADSTIRVPEKPDYADPAKAKRPNLLSRAVEMRMPAIAVTDLNNLFALIKLVNGAEKVGIKPIAGADLMIASSDDMAPWRLTVLCRDHDGYLTLSRLLTRAWMEGQRPEGGVAIRPEWHSEDVEQGAIKVIMTGSASDKDHLQSHIYNKQTKKRLEARFKDLNDPLKLVIVRDMWLTGFDAPCCHTMYIDKPMRGHNLMQAIARVNRVFRDKPGGLVVDYIGIANELKQALKTYTDSKGKGQTTVDAREAFAILLEKMDVIHGMFARSAGKPGFDYTGFSRDPLAFLRDAVNYILGLDDGKKRYLDVSLAMSKAWSLCNTLDEAKPLQEEFAFLSAVRVGLIKLDPKAKFSQSEKNSLLSKILDNAVVATGVEDVFALAGLDKPNIGLLSDEFLEEVREMPQRNLAVELLEKLLNDGIHARSGNNVVQQKKYSDRLKAVLLKYNNRAIETAQVIEELIQMAKAFQEAMARDDALGLTPDEIAFYDALAENESAVRELGDDTLRKLAIEVTLKLRQSTTVDWQVRESVRARLRILVRQTLRKYKYPPDKTPGAVELILKQAEVVSNSWTV